MHIFGTNAVLDDIRSPTYSTCLLNFHKAINKRQADSESLFLYVSISFFTLLFQLSRNSTSKKSRVIFFHIAGILFIFTSQANPSAIPGLPLPGLPLCRRSPQVYVGDEVHLWQTEQKQAACGCLNSSFVKSPVNQTIVYCEKTIGQRLFVECLPGPESIIIPGITQMSG